MDVQTTLQTLSAAHLPAILDVIERVTRSSTPEDSSLQEMTSYHMGTGGKRLRALLPLAVAQALGHDPATLLPFGAACELLHNATLVHDDLQDGDRVRRDHPTVWVRYGSERAINLGDAMLYVTLAMIDELELDVSLKHAATQRILRETLRVIDGQEREFLLKAMETPELSDYVRMVEGKTSGLFALPIVGAAALCGAPQGALDALQEAARHLGVVFQIQDDILDLYGNKGRGEVGSDLGEGKVSMLVVHALEYGEEGEIAWLKGRLAQDRAPVTETDVDRATALFEQSGALDAAFVEIDRRVAAALDAVASLDLPDLHALIAGLSDVFLAPLEGVRPETLPPA